MSYKENSVGSQNLYAIKTINNLEESLKSRDSSQAGETSAHLCCLNYTNN